MMSFKNHLLVFTITISAIHAAYGYIHSYSQMPTQCRCACHFEKGRSICDSVGKLINIVEANSEQLKLWATHRQFIEHFSERWRQEVAELVESTMEDYISERKLRPTAENLVQEMEDEMENTIEILQKPLTVESDLAKNVSNLLEKVESVENRTFEVEKELKSERRVRRHLEEEVKQTQTSLVYLGDQLQNATAPVDAFMDQVELKLYASLGDLNKTIYEDHLKKLYYKVDGVVYQNEIKKLDERLENVEVELHDGGNFSVVSKLTEDMKNLEENLYLLNSSIGDIVVSRIEPLDNSIGDILLPRIEILETETVRKDAAQVLEDKMLNLLNDTEMFKIALVDVLSDVQDIQNLEKKFQNFSEQLTKSLEAMQNQIEYLKNETLVSGVAEKATENDDAIEFSEPSVTDVESKEEMIISTTEYALTTYEHASTADEYASTADEYASTADEYASTADEYASTADATTDESVTTTDESVTTTDESVTTTDEYASTTDEYASTADEYASTADEYAATADEYASTAEATEYDEPITMELAVTPTVVIRSKIGGDDDSMPCDVPVIRDLHLLADVEESQGRQNLKFGCKPIGRYAVSHVPVPARCQNGSWINPFPTCTQLVTVTTIDALAEELSKEHPCGTGLGEFPDPTNCSQFFKCGQGRMAVVPCPSGLRFNAMLKVCDHPGITECTSVASKNVKQLQSLTPPIHIEPDNLDKQNSHLGTGRSGQLMVHPRSSFTLHCLYPDNVWGLPKWNVKYSHSDTNPRDLTVKKSTNRVSLTVTAAKEEDSGIYRCLTPFGQQHSVEVLVTVITCPSFYMEEEYEEVFYRPTPEGELRILGTTAEFQCEEGHKVIAQCMANGTWSRGIPSKKECSLKRRSSENVWNCQPLDVRRHPDLILERNDPEKIVTFKCSGGMRLLGNTFTRCLDDGEWSHISLPKCVRK